MNIMNTFTKFLVERKLYQKEDIFYPYVQLIKINADTNTKHYSGCMISRKKDLEFLQINITFRKINLKYD